MANDLVIAFSKKMFSRNFYLFDFFTFQFLLLIITFMLFVHSQWILCVIFCSFGLRFMLVELRWFFELENISLTRHPCYDYLIVSSPHKHHFQKVGCKYELKNGPDRRIKRRLQRWLKNKPIILDSFVVGIQFIGLLLFNFGTFKFIEKFIWPTGSATQTIDY